MPHITFPGRTTPSRVCASRVVSLALGAMSALAWAQDPLVGTFADASLTIAVEGDGTGSYVGRISTQGQSYPFIAQRHGGVHRFAGTFQVAAERYEFAAELQSDVLVLTTGGFCYRLVRRPSAASPDADAVRSGVRFTYRTGAVSDPGTNAGPDARGSGGEGFSRMDVVFRDDLRCVDLRTEYLAATGGGAVTPILGSSDAIVSRDGSCPSLWWPPAWLRDYAPPPGATSQTVVRGPFQLPQGGPTYEALTVREERADTRYSYAFDLETGLMLMYTDGTGAREAPAPAPTSSSYNVLVSIRQPELPWAAPTPLPVHVQNLQESTYRTTLTRDLEGVSFPGMAISQQTDVRFTVVDRDPYFLLLQGLAPGSVGAPVSTSVLASNASFFVHPEVLAQLRPGQLLDQDPVPGHRQSVEGANASGVVVLDQGAGFVSRQTFDPRTGLLMSVTS